MRERCITILYHTTENTVANRIDATYVRRTILIIYLFIYLFIYLSRGIQFSRASLNGALTKHKNKDIETLKLDN